MCWGVNFCLRPIDRGSGGIGIYRIDGLNLAYSPLRTEDDRGMNRAGETRICRMEGLDEGADRQDLCVKQEREVLKRADLPSCA